MCGVTLSPPSCCRSFTMSCIQTTQSCNCPQIIFLREISASVHFLKSYLEKSSAWLRQNITCQVDCHRYEFLMCAWRSHALANCNQVKLLKYNCNRDTCRMAIIAHSIIYLSFGSVLPEHFFALQVIRDRFPGIRFVYKAANAIVLWM